jgi:hypothetical protein
MDPNWATRVARIRQPSHTNVASARDHNTSARAIQRVSWLVAPRRRTPRTPARCAANEGEDDMRSIWTVCLAAGLLGACAPADDGPGGVVMTERPDARPEHPERASCVPGKPPCPTNTECVNFGAFGDQVCAELCQTDADCATGLVCIPDASGKGVCATEEWGGDGGIYPELYCRDQNVCNVHWDDNENGCRAYLNACLGGLSEANRAEWTREVRACVTNNSTCGAAFSCLDAVPWC